MNFRDATLKIIFQDAIKVEVLLCSWLGRYSCVLNPLVHKDVLRLVAFSSIATHWKSNWNLSSVCWTLYPRVFYNELWGYPSAEARFILGHATRWQIHQHLHQNKWKRKRFRITHVKVQTSSHLEKIKWQASTNTSAQAHSMCVGEYPHTIMNWNNVVKKNGPHFLHNNVRDWWSHTVNQDFLLLLNKAISFISAYPQIQLRCQRSTFSTTAYPLSNTVGLVAACLWFQST